MSMRQLIINEVSRQPEPLLREVWHYLSVLKSQTEEEPHTSMAVRRKLVETGDVDVISIRSNFFYTRAVPCELWHFDKGNPPRAATRC